MTGFEKILIEAGYKMHRFNSKVGEYVPTDRHNISTMGDISYKYIHVEDSNKVISFGLNEVGKPATLISPKPRVSINGIEMNQDLATITDDTMNRVLTNVDYSEILEAIFNRSKVIELNEG